MNAAVQIDELDLGGAVAPEAPALSPASPEGNLDEAPLFDEDTAPEGKFDWRDDKDVVIHEQLAVAVYRNQRDGIVIRQEAAYPGDDMYVVLRDENAALAVIRALQREVGEGS